MKIGIITPIHENDLKYLKVCVQAIKLLNTRPEVSLKYLNNGEKGLGFYRSELFDWAFEYCDVVLNCSVDHQLHRNILAYVSGNKITTFAYFKMKPSYVLDYIRFKLSPSMWTGCYSITRDFWKLFRKSDYYVRWNGEDYSIVLFAKEIGYPIKRVRKPLYTLLNPSKSDPFKDIDDYPLWKKVIRKISWIDH